MALQIRKTRATCKLTVLFIPELCDTQQHPVDQSLCVIQGERYPGLSVSGEQSRVTAKHSLGFALAQRAPFDFIPTIEINIHAMSDSRDSCDEQVWERSVLPLGGGGEGRDTTSRTNWNAVEVLVLFEADVADPWPKDLAFKLLALRWGDMSPPSASLYTCSCSCSPENARACALLWNPSRQPVLDVGSAKAVLFLEGSGWSCLEL